MQGGPLADTRLREVEACLNDGRLDEAQRALTALGNPRHLGPGVRYLTTRLLFLRGRLDAQGVHGRLEEVMVECPDFPEAQALLRLTSPPGAPSAPLPAIGRKDDPPPSSPEPSKQPASRSRHRSSRPPRVTISRRPEFRLDTPGLPPPPASAPTAPPPLDLGTLEKPRSELPTEPAPPPNEESTPPPFDLGRVDPELLSPGPWHEVDAYLASGQARSALAALEKLARARLDTLLVEKMPNPQSVARESMAFWATAPAACHFAPFDLSLKSLERLDALLTLLAPGSSDVPFSALSILVACYAGECVRATRGGSWHGRIAEPDTLGVAFSDEFYAPLLHAERAIRGVRALRADAGPTPHPGAEPPEPVSQKPIDPPTPWDPDPWPPLAMLAEIGRAVPTSAVGTWARRTLKMPLDRTFESVRAVARYLSLVRGDGGALHGKAERRATILAGAYLGELICLHRAGRWSDNDAAPESPLAYEVLLPDGSASYPVLLAHHELAQTGRETLLERLNAALGRG